MLYVFLIDFNVIILYFIANYKLGMDEHERINCISFNQDYGCFIISTY